MLRIKVAKLSDDLVVIGMEEIILDPIKYIDEFKTKEDFRIRAGYSTVDELKFDLKVFQDNELYEYCEIIKEVINSKNGN